MSRNTYTFGPFQLDIVEQVLLRDGKSLPLKPKVFEVLSVLVQNSGRLVCKDELMKQVWANSFVEEGNLSVSIFEIRKVLGASPNGHKYIETVPRRGYRFVSCETDAAERKSAQPNDADIATQILSRPLAGYPRTTKGSIAVLPFKFIGGPGNEYLGLGMADALITRLSNLRQVIVRPTSAVRKYTGAQDSVTVGRELGVEWVLDGSVQKTRHRIRVTVQLVGVRSNVLLWAEKFDERFTDILAVEDSISEQVSKALAPKLTGNEKRALAKRSTEDPEAYEAYLRGRYFLDKGTTEACTTAIQYFEHAIAIDLNYALAYAGLAHCYLIFGGHKRLSTLEYNSKAERAIMMALALDAELAEAHSSLGSLRMRQWDWAGAEEELKNAIELNPNYVISYVAYANYLGLTGRVDEAMTEIAKARKIDPLSLPMNAAKGSLLYLAGKYDNAIEQLQNTLALDADFAPAYFSLGVTYEALGRYDEAVMAYERSQRGLGNLLELSGCLGRIYAFRGMRAKALRTIKKLRSTSRNHGAAHYSIALIYCALGETDDAFLSLEDAYSDHDDDLFLIKVDPRLNSIREDPRFFRLSKQIGL